MVKNKIALKTWGRGQNSRHSRWVWCRNTVNMKNYHWQYHDATKLKKNKNKENEIALYI